MCLQNIGSVINLSWYNVHSTTTTAEMGSNACRRLQELSGSLGKLRKFRRRQAGCAPNTWWSAASWFVSVFMLLLDTDSAGCSFSGAWQQVESIFLPIQTVRSILSFPSRNILSIAFWGWSLPFSPAPREELQSMVTICSSQEKARASLDTWWNTIGPSLVGQASLPHKNNLLFHGERDSLCLSVCLSVCLFVCLFAVSLRVGGRR